MLLSSCTWYLNSSSWYKLCLNFGLHAVSGKVLMNTIALYFAFRMPSRVLPFCPFLDAMIGCLTRVVVGQYKVNAKKFRFLSHEMSRRHNVAFSAIFGQKRPRVAIFWPKIFSKIPKNFKKILNCLKIIVEQKEKRFWKALCPNKLISYQNNWLF